MKTDTLQEKLIKLWMEYLVHMLCMNAKGLITFRVSKIKICNHWKDQVREDIQIRVGKEDTGTRKTMEGQNN
jgi:hypothetical protein